MKQIILNEQRPNLIVPIVEADLQDTLSVITLANQSAADVIELRIDYWKNLRELTPDTFHLINETSELPIILTWRTSTEGGKKIYDKTLYEQIYINAIKSGIEAVDIEYRLFYEVERLIDFAKSNKTKVIGSYHNFIETPSDLKNIISAIDRSRADIVKVAVMPQIKNDVTRVLKLTKSVVKPAIVISMGQLGNVSRYKGIKFGSKFTFGTLGKLSAPGQPTIEELNRYFLEENHEKIK
ncbi:type I 3-dehydroquinate dehydratase [Companilactobacillus insicii]|uniref:type I 3-dehydroquinate dehydratase n=1 Tax=Companilactobacillus insicii TaxID=1732567 RepID=UPI000F78F8F0|nr:type I 3-dehydroquinate dehydratase [Companilactobacillus insicii]